MWRLELHFYECASGVREKYSRCWAGGAQRIVDVAGPRAPDDNLVLIEKSPKC